MVRFLLLIIGIISFVQPAVAANQPGFVLGFNFKPPLAATMNQQVILDVCTDAACGSLVASIPLRCEAQPNRAGIVTGLSHCSAKAVAGGRLDVNLSLLDHPATLRLRSGSLTSPPIGFPGAVPTAPRTVYKFTVRPSSRGFVILPG